MLGKKHSDQALPSALALRVVQKFASRPAWGPVDRSGSTRLCYNALRANPTASPGQIMISGRRCGRVSRPRTALPLSLRLPPHRMPTSAPTSTQRQRDYRYQSVCSRHSAKKWVPKMYFPKHSRFVRSCAYCNYRSPTRAKSLRRHAGAGREIDEEIGLSCSDHSGMAPPVTRPWSNGRSCASTIATREGQEQCRGTNILHTRARDREGGRLPEEPAWLRDPDASHRYACSIGVCRSPASIESTWESIPASRQDYLREAFFSLEERVLVSNNSGALWRFPTTRCLKTGPSPHTIKCAYLAEDSKRTALGHSTAPDDEARKNCPKGGTKPVPPHVESGKHSIQCAHGGVEDLPQYTRHLWVDGYLTTPRAHVSA